MKTALLRVLLCLTVTAADFCCSLNGQILVAGKNYNSVGAYNFNGTTIDAFFASNSENFVNYPQGITTDGTNLYVANGGSDAIGKFNLFSGEFESNIPAPAGYGIAIAGTNLYIVNADGVRVSQYAVNGQSVNFNLISFTNQNPIGIAVVGTNLYVTIDQPSGYVGKFNLDGTAVNRELISGLSRPVALASDGTYLYVANVGNGTTGQGTIGQYGLDGTTNNAALISGLSWPNGIAINGSTLYVLEVSGQVLSYTVDGDLLDSNLISSSASVGPCYGILPINALRVSPAAIQSNVFAFNITGLSNQSIFVSASTGFTNWIPLETNTLGSGSFLFTDPAWTNFPSRFYRVGAL